MMVLIAIWWRYTLKHRWPQESASELIAFTSANWITGAVLARAGFEASPRGRQSAHALSTIRLLLAAAPVAQLLVGFVMQWRPGLTQQAVAEVCEQ